MLDAIEVVARLGNTMLEVRYVTDGHYTFGDQTFGLEIPEGPPSRFRVGLVDLTMRRVEAPRRGIPAPAIDRRPLRYIGGSLVAHLLLAFLMVPAFAEPEPSIGASAMVDDGALSMRTVTVASEIGDSPDHSTNGGGSPMQGDAGAAGSFKSTQATGHIQVARRDHEPALSRDEAIASARNAGFLGTASVSAGFAAITGTADLSSGFDTADVHGPLFGGVGEGGVSFGIARSGFGTGAGCTGTDCNGIIGVGRYGTLSNGKLGGEGWGGALAAGDYDLLGSRSGRSSGYSTRSIGDPWGRRRTAAVPTVIMCGTPACVHAIGGLDKAIIRRYIRRELPKIQYCYEKELLATPGLGGTLTTEFMIATDGTVQTATAGGMGEPVASCVAGVLKNIKFPRSTEGNTQVHYPFEFRSAGS